MRQCLSILLCLLALQSTAQEVVDGQLPSDLTEAVEADTVQPQKSYFWQKGFLGNVVNYFDKADDIKPLDKFDIGFIGGPDINSTTGIGIGLCGSGLYHLQPTNSDLQQSCITITARATSKAMFTLLLVNEMFFPDDRYRSSAKLELSTFKNQFWGLGYEQNEVDANESNYTENYIRFDGNFMLRLAHNLYMGPTLYYQYYTADKRDAICNTLLSFRDHQSQVLAAGLGVSYDTRDCLHDAHRGMYLNFQQRMSPAFSNTAGTFSTTDLQLAGYQPAWKGCVIAGELHSMLNVGHATPWTEYAQVGSNYRMRGYYKGRYRDRNIIEAQLEFRQHLWKRFGMVGWVGAANNFHDTESWRWSHTLPNYGAGIRWRFKPGVNVRFDYGFTRNGSGFIFCINEAF